MTNPAQLLIAGNPGKRRRHSKSKRTTSTTSLQGTSAMATRRKRRKARHSPARVAKRRAKRVARRSKRKGKMPAGLAAYWKAKRGGKVVRKARRAHHRRGAKSHKRRSRRRAKVRSHRRARRTRTVSMPKGSTVIVRRRGRKGRKGRRVARVKVNAGSVSLMNTVTGFHHNLSATFKGGAKAWLAAAAGAGVSVIGGTFMSRLTGNLLGKFAPALLTNDIASRGIGALNYLIPAYLAAKFTPGISGKTRRALQAGGMAAALIEALKPGMVRDALAHLPVVGGAFGPALSGMADGMGDYLAYGLQGLGWDESGGTRAAAAITSAMDGDDESMGDYVGEDGSLMGDYLAFQGR